MTDPSLMEDMLRNAVAWLHKEVMAEEDRKPGSSWRLHLVDVITTMRTADVLERTAAVQAEQLFELQRIADQLSRIGDQLE